MTIATPVLYKVADGVATITLNRPDQMNTFDEAMFDGLNRAIARFRADDDARVVILTASGDRAFSAGLDVKAGNALVQSGDMSRQERFECDFLDSDLGGKPVILTAFGHCVGQAVALAAWADIRIAATGTRFSLPEAQLGISAVSLPGLLVDLIGSAQAAYMLLYGGQLEADWALRSGFVHEVVPPEALMERAHAVARTMVGQAPMALQAHKQLLRAARTTPRAELLHMGEAFRQQTLTSEDFREGLRAFIEKRRPVFVGR
ncbi:enoyl-CoA hydratase/isomerase family protein [Sedimentitalea sp. XS_ASV28]|uniref:enoyl-CoA hydratase/isomerase family protein n=1 Tax=Sedimentitalea sp. XS_ASV28 TaxID=3241296 RepID=UPI00351796F9